MEGSAASWLVIALAAAAANLPFVNERLFACVPLKGARKAFFLRLVELVVLYFVVGGVGYLLEAKAGNVFPQRWEFYAVTGCLFLVLAFPGFVLRYLRRQHDND